MPKKILKKVKKVLSSVLKKKKRPTKKEIPKEKPISRETRIEEAKYFVRPEEKRPKEMPKELPLGYGEDKIVLQTRDPWWIHAYWEVIEKTKEKLRRMWGEDFLKAKRVLRCYDVSHIIFDGKNAHRYFDIEITESANNWYINTGTPGTSWIVDLGLILPNNQFIPIVRSNVTHTPIPHPSPLTDEEWMVPEEMFAKLYGVGLGVSSPIGKAWQERLKKEWASLAVASPGMFSLMSPVKKIEKGFWLVVNTELIVYGATESNARVTVQGRPIPLRDDGTFTLRFFLPDGKQNIPVRAVSFDGSEERTITPIVTKETK